MASTLLLLVLFCAVFSAMKCDAATTTCPRNYVEKLGQCIPETTRLLPLRSLSVWTGPKKMASPHVLLDKRRDTYLALTPKQQTVARVGTGNRKYLVFRVELFYRNPTNMNVPVSVYNKNNSTLFAQGHLNRKTSNGHLQLWLKTPSTGLIPTGKGFQVVVGKASNKVEISDLSLFGGSTPGAAKQSTVVWALAVVVDFSNTKLEQFQNDTTAFNDVQAIRQQLNLMERHWKWMSRGKNIMEWSIIRIQMDDTLAPAQFNNNWWEFRNALAQKVEDAVNITEYDSNNDGIIDQVWGILATKEHQDYESGNWSWMMGGRSTHQNTDMFIDDQGAYAVQVRCTGCFNHEVGHGANIGLPDLYGKYGNLGSLTLMGYSWYNMPGTLIAWEMTKLNWLTPTKVHETARGLRLKPLEEGGGAVQVQKNDTSGEYFMVEYRKTPIKRFGSALGNYDGLLITHVYENAQDENRALPPLVRMEAADLNPQYETFPEGNDLWYPGNHIMQPAFEAKSYDEGSIVIFRIENFIRSGDYIGFDVSFENR